MRKILPFILIAVVVVAAYYFYFSSKSFSQPAQPKNATGSLEEKYFQSLTQDEVQKTVFFALPDRALKPQNSGKVFCSDKIYGYEFDDQINGVDVYLYTYCEEYYIKADKAALGTALSSYAILKFKITDNSLVYDSISLTNQSTQTNFVNEFFPKKYRNEALKTVDSNSLIPTPKTQAENYYKGKLEVYF